MPVTDRKQIALLIDAENISRRYIELIFREISAYGFATYKRVYGNTDALKVWQDVILKYAMTPIVQFNYTSGKNASDSALIIDAMDILYARKVDGFCLVTSDSDFTKLAIRLREAGMFVIGMGNENTPEPLIHACEEFKYLDMLMKDSPASDTQNNSQETDSILPSEDALKDKIADILGTVFQDKEWVNLSALGNVLPKNIPGFSVKFYGCTKLRQLIAKFSDRFEMNEMRGGDSVPVLYVRDKQ